MTFKELEYIAAIAKYRNITKAAESLYIGQPSLTKYLQRVEAELGAKLFVKAGSQYIPTEAGERYLEAAKQILEIKDRLAEDIRSIQNPKTGTLRVGFPLARGEFILPEVVPEFNRLYPQVQLEIHETDSLSLRSALLKDELDLAFINSRRHDSELSYRKICSQELVLAVPRGHPLCAQAAERPGGAYPELGADALSGVKFIVLSRGGIIDELFSRLGLAPDILASTKHMGALLDMVSSGCGVGIIYDSLYGFVKEQYAFSLLSFGGEAAKSEFSAVRRKAASLPEYAKVFTELVARSHGA